jgi:hypothetical protein
MPIDRPGKAASVRLFNCAGTGTGVSHFSALKTVSQRENIQKYRKMRNSGGKDEA